MLKKVKVKQKFLRFASFFLMAALLLGSIRFSNPQEAKAANGNATRRMAYVLSNVYGKSGAGSSASIPGSSSLPAPFNKSHVSMYGMAVYTGSTYRLTYCIGHNIHLPAGTELHDYNNIYSSSNGGDTWYKLDDWQKQYLQLALTYGLNDENATHTKGGIQSLINSNKALYGVTQSMVWGIVHAKSRAWFSNNHTKIRNHFLVSRDYDKFDEIYKNMVSAYNKEIPSFAKETKANAKAGAKLLKGNNMEQASTYTFKDSTGLLNTGKNNKKGYTEIEGISTTSQNAKASDIKAKINHDTGQLTVTCPKGTIKSETDTRTYTIKLKTYYGRYNDYKNKTQSSVPMATCWQRSNHKGQPQVQHTDKINVSSSYVSVKIIGKGTDDWPSTLRIHKTSSDGIVDGWRFFIRANSTETNYYNTENGTDYEVSQLYAKEITTDGGGNAIITDLDAGVYDLWEVGYGYAKYSKSNTGVESETGYAYSNKDQSAVLGMYRKTADTSTAYNTASSTMYTAKGENINITSGTNSNGGTSGIFNKYNQGHIRIVIRKDSEESVTIHNERLTNTMNVEKTYIKNEDCPSWGSQVILDDATISLSASVNTGSAWASLNNDLRTKFGINYYYDKTNIADMLIQEGSGYKASTGDFNILPNINAVGAAYTTTTNDGETNYYVTASSSGKLTETVSSQGTKLYSMTNDGVISDLTGNIPLYRVTNILRDRFLEIEKKDATTHKRVKRAGFGFEIHDAYSGKKLANSKGQTTFYTDDSGIATFGTYDTDKTGRIQNVKKERVPYGTYIVYETEAPSPYIKSERTFFFTVSPEGTEFFDEADDPENKNLDTDLVESTTTDSGERTEDDAIQEDPAYGSNYTDTGEEAEKEDSLTAGDSSDYSEGTGEDSTEMNETIPSNNKYDSSIEGGDSYGEESEALKILRAVQKNIYAYSSVSMKDISQNTSRISFGFENTEQLGKIVVYKTGTTYTKSDKNVSIKETKYGKQYVLKHTLTDLSDVEYTIYADGEIQSGTGETLFKDGEVVGIMKTKNGKASFDGLHVGSYILTETETLKGYILPKGSTHFTIDHEGQNVVREFSFNNQLQTMNVEIWKKMEDYSTYSDAYKGVLFGLYTKKEITDEKGDVLIPANALVDTTTVTPKDDYFVGNFEKKLPYGSYYVKEIKTDNRYILDATEYPVEFQFVDYTTKVVKIRVNMENGGYVFNYLKPIGKITPTYEKDTPTGVVKTSAKKPSQTFTSKISVPKTGDDTPLGLYWFLLIASSFPIVWMLSCKFRKRTRVKKVKGSRMLLFLLLLSCFLLCREDSFAKEVTDTITKEKVYKTEEADYVRGMPQNTFKQEIEENGKTFVLDQSDIKYTIKSVIPKYEQVKTTYQVSKSGLSEKNYDPDQAVMTTDKYGNEVMVKLQSVSYKTNRSMVIQNVTAKTDFGDLIEEPVVPQKNTTSVKNKITGNKENVTCSLKDVTKSAAKWKEDKASTIMVEGYGSSHYRLGGVTLDADSVEDLTSNGDVILNYLGLDTATHKIVGVTWNGDAFDQTVNGNTIRCRRATAKISRKVRTYVANYTGAIQIPVTTYTGTAYYSSNSRVQVGQEYEVKATAHYVQTEMPVASPEPTKKPQTKPVKEEHTSNVPLIAAISVGIVILCVCIVLILYYSSKRKKAGGAQNG